MPQKPSVPRTCAWCGKEFLAQPRDAAKGRARFCSRYCCGAAGGRRTNELHPQVGEGNHNFKGWLTRDKVAYVRRSEAKYPARARARHEAKKAMMRGELVRPAACTRCGATDQPIHAHHPNYRKPLSVEWLCRPCHRALHEGLRQAS
jgi:predicted Zn-ribbon and HTH transcriptional regulator